MSQILLGHRLPSLGFIRIGHRLSGEPLLVDPGQPLTIEDNRRWRREGFPGLGGAGR